MLQTSSSDKSVAFVVLANWVQMYLPSVSTTLIRPLASFAGNAQQTACLQAATEELVDKMGSMHTSAKHAEHSTADYLAVIAACKHQLRVACATHTS